MKKKCQAFVLFSFYSTNFLLQFSTAEQQNKKERDLGKNAQERPQWRQSI